MKSIADFKREMKIGSTWLFTADWWPLAIVRTCERSQSNSFALTSPRDPKTRSWCDWPKKSEVEFSKDGLAITITHKLGWLRYEIVDY